jgi:cytochrome c-type biogenesis protein CcmF
MNYIGEHLLPGQIGHFFTLLFLVSSLVATLAFFIAGYGGKSAAEAAGWQKIARISFAHTIILNTSMPMATAIEVSRLNIS